MLAEALGPPRQTASPRHTQPRTPSPLLSMTWFSGVVNNSEQNLRKKGKKREGGRKEGRKGKEKGKEKERKGKMDYLLGNSVVMKCAKNFALFRVKLS